MIASLPMYDRPETRAAYNRLWGTIRDDLAGLGLDVPEALSWPGNPWDHWLSSDLALSQTCGFPFRTRLYDKVHLVGTPDFGLPGCAPGYNNSVIVMRDDDGRTAPGDWPDLTLAVNAFDSQSGWAAPVAMALVRGVAFAATVETGSHRASVDAVADGRADIAAVDAQTWRMICRWDSVADRVKEVMRTEPTPGLPLITTLSNALPDLAAAVERCFRALPEDDRAILDIKGVAAIPAARYLEIPTPPRW